MADPNLRDFYNRVARIEAARSKGYGFEAPGTLGLSYYARHELRKSSIVGPLLVALIVAFSLKGAILQKMGPEAYEARVDALEAGQGFDKVGSWIMRADPATLWVSQLFDNLFNYDGLGRCTASLGDLPQPGKSPVAGADSSAIGQA